MMIYPDGKVPVIQISILNSLNPEAHFRMGQALRELKREGFLIIGSGSSVHNCYEEDDAIKHSLEFDMELSRQIEKS
jgi:aromatic ring-opening dioxygenase catalytic subunit (LigB family)